MRNKYLIYLSFLILISFTIKGQIDNDAGMWNTFSLIHPFSKKTSLVIDQEFRLRENYQRINLFYTNLGVDYKLNKFIKISPTYRFVQKKQFEGTYSFRHRLMLDVTLKKKIKAITFSQRIRYQIEVRDFYTSKKGPLPEQYLRFKSELKYPIKEKFTINASCELRYQLRDPRGKGPLSDNTFHRIRNVLGLDYQLDKRSTFSVYYLTQTEFNITSPENIFILGLGYSITI